MGQAEASIFLSLLSQPIILSKEMSSAYSGCHFSQQCNKVMAFNSKKPSANLSSKRQEDMLALTVRMK